MKYFVELFVRAFNRLKRFHFTQTIKLDNYIINIIAELVKRIISMKALYFMKQFVIEIISRMSWMLKSNHCAHFNIHSAPLVVKKLRYLARFVVVALLLNRADVVKSLHESLSGLAEEYNQVFKPSDYSDWKVVLSEISTFIEVNTLFLDRSNCIIGG